MSVSQEAKQLILDHLDKVSDLRSENWSDLKWDIITKVMNRLNGPGVCVIDQFAASCYYDDVFYEYPK